MDIEVNLKNQNKAQYLLELLRSLDFVESVNIKSSADEVVEKRKGVSQFDKFYGSLNSGKTHQQIDEQLKEMRNEWERTI